MTVHPVPRAVVAGTFVPKQLAPMLYRQFRNGNTKVLALPEYGLGRSWHQSYHTLRPQLYNRPQKLGHSQGALTVLEDVLNYPHLHKTVILMSGAFGGSWAAPFLNAPGIRSLRVGSSDLIDLERRKALRLNELAQSWPVGLRIIALSSAHDGLLTPEGVYPNHPCIECYCLATAPPRNLPDHVQWIQVDELVLPPWAKLWLAQQPWPARQAIARLSERMRFHLTEGLLPATRQVVDALWDGWQPAQDASGIIRVPSGWTSGLRLLPAPEEVLEAA